jgi:glycogen phosphorylase
MDRRLRQERWRGLPDALPELLASLSDEELWVMAGEERKILIQQVHARLARHLGSRGYLPEVVDQSANVLDPNALTLGFARRFTGYKRPNLLLTDPARLGRLLNDPARPVQLMLAGKAHPGDKEGKEMIREWIDLAQRPEFRRRVVFLEDYGSPRSLCRAWMSGQHAPAAVGGVRHERHEGSGQRRPQPLRTRRLMGRGLRA